MVIPIAILHRAAHRGARQGSPRREPAGPQPPWPLAAFWPTVLWPTVLWVAVPGPAAPWLAAFWLAARWLADENASAGVRSVRPSATRRAGRSRRPPGSFHLGPLEAERSVVGQAAAAQDQFLVDVVRDDERELGARFRHRPPQWLRIEHPAEERDVVFGEPCSSQYTVTNCEGTCRRLTSRRRCGSDAQARETPMACREGRRLTSGARRTRW